MRTTYDGLIRMDFMLKDNKTVATKLYREGNFRISSSIPLNNHIAYYFIISTGGGYTEGESYFQEIKLQSGSHVILTTQTPNYIFKCENNIPTTHNNVIYIGNEAVLEYYMDDTIPYADSLYIQSTEVLMEKGSKLILTDGLTSGWDPDDRLFKYSRVELKLNIKKSNKLILNDLLLVDPKENLMFELGYFEGKNNFNSVVIIDENINLEIVKQLNRYMKNIITKSVFGITLLEEGGIVFRVLGYSSYDNHHLMSLFIDYYRQNILNFESIQLRKSDYFNLGE
ncbi:hypothetical protein A5806_002659 [Enterococcus faecium]|uniref:urease accessory protein UreD n=1 Tax=Enterococcus faecium TaxID=1352 RepID=UPI000B3EC981|nr:urease accessory protein UreD [Enterococcus faecium]OUZ27848.1 hypothetical protein A5806_002659 [Enterococcus faecium]